MKKKVFICLAVVCALAFAAIFATLASARECGFYENGDYYACFLTDSICDTNHLECRGIKMLVLPGNPPVI